MMLRNLFSSVIEVTLIMSIIIVALLALHAVIKKKLTAKWSCFVWLLIAFRLALPFNIPIPDMAFQIEPPVAKEITVVKKSSDTPNQVTKKAPVTEIDKPSSSKAATQESSSPNATQPTLKPERITIDFVSVAAWIWLIGMFLIAVYQVISYLSIRREIRRFSTPISNQNVMATYEVLKQEMHLKKKIPLKLCKKIATPMLVGFMKPMILLPTVHYSMQECYGILKHECIHHKRHDPLFKLLLMVVQTIHWFNPFVYIMSYFAKKDIELSCDAEVIKKMNFHQRKEYSLTLLNSLEVQVNQKSRLSAAFSEDKRTVKDRFIQIFDTSKKKKGIFALIAIALVVAIGGSLLMFGTREVQQVNDKLSITIREQTLDDIEKVIDEFKREYPKIEVTINKIPMQYNPNLIKKIQTEIMAGKGTDIVVLPLDNDMNLEKVALSGAFCDINTMLKEDISFNRELYFESVLDAGVYKGKQIFMPLSFNVPMLLTTQECLNKYEIDTNKLNTLSDMYATFAKTINTHDINRLFTNSYDMNRFLSYAITTISKTQINNLADDNSLKKICDEYKQVYPISNTKMSLDVVNMCPYDAMKEDKTVFVNTSSLADFYYRYYLIAEHGVTPIFKPIPSPKGGVQAYLGDSVAISSNSPNKQNAYHFLKIALSEKLQHVNQYGGFEMPYFPVLRSGVQNRINLFKQQITGENRLSEEERLNKFTELEQRQLDNILNSINYCISNANNYSFAYSELEPYFKNEKTYDQCIKKLQSKLDIYLTE
ncbi:extracellular solute-binding protein [Paludicola sp. MB14-C6]|uniref:extracellular solute-binding protein n=1 Tax=Paludihabitans sp. MB14-C6 TaxID=3070656 RepID=UPI0027DE0D3F|nr:extracellular solute-binding protein [Paludicola sp. MB14-C6]WMJ22341.1 extracellular solute-binding protein [Paludicola sp. MB14-C6]